MVTKTSVNIIGTDYTIKSIELLIESWTLPPI